MIGGMGFAFEYVGLSRPVRPNAHWLSGRDDAQQLNIFGRLKEGAISKGDSIYLPCAGSRHVVGTVGAFMETLQDWIGLPFYGRLDAHSTPFCIAIFLPLGDYAIIYPSIALPPPVELTAIVPES